MSDCQELNGYWVQVDCNEDGMEMSAEEGGLGAITEMDNGKFVVRTKEGQTILAGSYTVDSDAKPAQINWTDTTGEDEGKTFLAIYNLSATGFEFCAADAGMARPVSIEPQKGHTIRSFTRLKGLSD